MVKDLRSTFNKAKNSLKPRRVTRDLGVIKIKSGADVATAGEFLYELIGARKAGFDDVTIDVSKLLDSGLYPNVATPIAALLDIGREKTDFTPSGSNEYIDHLGLFQPYAVKNQLSYQRNVLNKVWTFETSEDTFRLTREYIDEIYKTMVVDTDGILAALEWCLGEVLENAMLHSNAPKAYVMGQIHMNKKHVAFSIVDLGQGIYNSLADSGRYSPRTPIDAITLAMKEGVTRNEKTNQGNGLWGLHNIIRNNKGSLTIVSAGGGIVIRQGKTWSFKTRRFGFMGGGTIVDFQFDLDSPVSLKTVMGGYEPKPLAILNSADERGDIHYKLIDQKDGFGARESGVRIRNEILNLQYQTGGKVILDFSGITVVTSSFADELVGKLYAELGPINFNTLIQLENMSETVRVIIERAVLQRLSH